MSRKDHQLDRAKARTSRRDVLRDETGDLGTGEGALKVALVYPNSYRVGMASLGFQTVRRQARELGFTRVERAFALGWGDAGRSGEPKGPGSPGRGDATSGASEVRTLETDRPLGTFDVLAFSAAFEMDYLHILQTLDAAGLPLFARDRGEGYPLVAVGGVAAAVCPSAIRPYVDAIAFGGGEATIRPLLTACEESGGFPRDRAARVRIFERLDTVANVEVTPGARQAVGMEGGESREPRRGEALARDAELPVSEIVTPRAELGRRVLVEIAHGCPNRCVFCWVGHNGGPYVARPAEEILGAAEEACVRTGCGSVGLVSSAVGAHPEIDAICEGFLSRGRKISFSSLRAEEVRPSMLEALARSGQRGLTLAPETGDAGLRRSLGKGLGDEGFMEVIEKSQRAGLEELKLYFMIGLPGESEEAVDAIVSFADRARRILLDFGRERGRVGKLSVNLGIYVPKPNTPLAKKERPGRAAIRKRVRRVVRSLEALPNVRVAPPSVDLFTAQEILSAGGDAAAKLVLEAFESAGDWRRALRKISPA